MTFPVQAFLESLNQHCFAKGSAETWYISNQETKGVFRLDLAVKPESDQYPSGYQVSMTLDSRNLVTLFWGDFQGHERYASAFPQAFCDIDVDCFLHSSHLPPSGEYLQVTTEKSKHLHHLLKPLLRNIDFSSKHARFTYHAEKHQGEIPLELDFEAGTITLRLMRDTIMTLSSEQDVAAFVLPFTERIDFFQQLLEKALNIARQYDPAAYILPKEPSLVVYKKTIRINAVYRLENENFSPVFMGDVSCSCDRFDYQSFFEREATELEQKLLTHLKKYMQKYRLQAAIRAEAEDFYHQLCGEIFQENVPFSSYYQGEMALSKLQQCLKQHTIEPLEERIRQQAETVLLSDKDSVPSGTVFSKRIKEVFGFGDYVLIFIEPALTTHPVRGMHQAAFTSLLKG